jgi:hypothetical protein
MIYMVYLSALTSASLGTSRNVGEDALRKEGVTASVGVASKIPHNSLVGNSDLVILIRTEHVTHVVVAPPIAEVYPTPLLVVGATGEAAVDSLSRHARSCHATAGAACTVTKIINGVALPSVHVGISVWKPWMVSFKGTAQPPRTRMVGAPD